MRAARARFEWPDDAGSLPHESEMGVEFFTITGSKTVKRHELAVAEAPTRP